MPHLTIVQWASLALSITLAIVFSRSLLGFVVKQAVIYYLVTSVAFRSFRYAAIMLLPRRLCSRLAGKAFAIRIPTFLRSLVYRFWIIGFNVQTEDFDTSLDSFESLSQFFNRRILPSRRPIANPVDQNVIYAPADSRFSILQNFSDTPNCEVKGVNFTFQQLTRSTQIPNKRICFAVYYLSPGDFHDFVSFNTFEVEKARLINGDFLPVNTLFMSRYKGCLAANERIVLEGSFGGRRAWYVAVAALNVGDIVIYDSEMRSYNEEYWDHHKKTYQCGQGIGQFKLGSTVVVCFELNDNEIAEPIEEGKVQYGQATVRITTVAQE